MGGVKKTKDYPQSSVYSKNEKILKMAHQTGG